MAQPYIALRAALAGRGVHPEEVTDIVCEAAEGPCTGCGAARDKQRSPNGLAAKFAVRIAGERVVYGGVGLGAFTRVRSATSACSRWHRK